MIEPKCSEANRRDGAVREREECCPEDSVDCVVPACGEAEVTIHTPHILLCRRASFQRLERCRVVVVFLAPLAGISVRVRYPSTVPEYVRNQT